MRFLSKLRHFATLQKGEPVPRPYAIWSIAQLEAEFERVQDEGDRQGLVALKAELRLRTTERSRQLMVLVERFAGSAVGPTPQTQNQGAATAKQPHQQGAGPKQGQPQGAGQKQGQPQGAGHKQTQPQGSGSKQSQQHGAGQKQGQPQGTGPKQGQPQGAGQKQTQPQGAGPKQAQPHGAGQKQGQPQGAGPNQAQSQGAGPRQGQPQGAGSNQAQQPQAAGPKQSQPQGAGQKQTQPQGAGSKHLQPQAASATGTPYGTTPNGQVVPGAGANPAGRSRPRLTPTAEQLHAVEQFKAGGSLKINAYAGTGKTSTLEFLAQSTRRRGQYIAFNKSIVVEAREKFPPTVNCSTTHSMAFKAIPSSYKHDQKMTGRMGAHQLAEALKLKRWQVDKYHVFQPRSLGFLIQETLRHFMQSAEREPLAEHVPQLGSLAAAPPETMAAVADFAVRGAKHVWKRMTDPNDIIPLGHDGYLKLWALGNPRIPVEFILLDEAQDTNPVVLDVLRRQPAQMIYVGDRYQQIYQWRGAINAMETLETDKSSYLTMSFRFGKPIAEAASQVLALLDEKHVITGNPAIDSRIERVKEPDAILGRTNVSTITALIDSLNEGKSPFLVGGTGELIAMLKGVADLKRGMQSTVPEFFGFNKWTEVIDFSESDEGHDLTTLVNLVGSHGEIALKWALESVVSEECCDIIISTAHKAKGREWQRVRLMDDFLRMEQLAAQYPPGRDPRPPDPAEARLFYVALTRAIERVEVPAPILSLMRD